MGISLQFHALIFYENFTCEELSLTFLRTVGSKVIRDDMAFSIEEIGVPLALFFSVSREFNNIEDLSFPLCL